MKFNGLDPEREAGPASGRPDPPGGGQNERDTRSKRLSPDRSEGQTWQVVAEFTLPNEAGREDLARRGAAALVEAVGELHLPPARLVRIKNAVARAAQNVGERGSQSQPGQPISLRVLMPAGLPTAGSGEPGTRSVDNADANPPATPRGWGYFMVEKMTDPGLGNPQPVIELFLYQEGNH